MSLQHFLCEQVEDRNFIFRGLALMLGRSLFSSAFTNIQLIFVTHGKVALSTDQWNGTTAPSGSTGLGSCLWSWHGDHLINTWSCFALYVFLFKNTLLNIYCWLIKLNQWQAAPKLPELLSNTWIFYIRYITVFLLLGTLTIYITSAHYIWEPFQTVKSPKKSTQCKKYGTK